MCERQTAKEMVEYLLALKDEQKILVACTLWRSWIRRNKINAKEKEWNLNELLSQIRYWATGSKHYCQKEVTYRTAIEEQQWSAPDGDWIKINTDGSFFLTTNSGGWGFIARDQHGMARGAGAGHLVVVASAAHASKTILTESESLILRPCISCKSLHGQTALALTIFYLSHVSLIN
jgi:hypothetical protein